MTMANQTLHLTANSSAIPARLCPASKQVVFQGSRSALLAAGELVDRPDRSGPAYRRLLSFAPTPLTGLRLRSTYQGRWSRLRFSGRKRNSALFLAMLAAQQPAL